MNSHHHHHHHHFLLSNGRQTPCGYLVPLRAGVHCSQSPDQPVAGLRASASLPAQVTNSGLGSETPLWYPDEKLSRQRCFVLGLYLHGRLDDRARNHDVVFLREAVSGPGRCLRRP